MIFNERENNKIDNLFVINNHIDIRPYLEIIEAAISYEIIDNIILNENYCIEDIKNSEDKSFVKKFYNEFAIKYLKSELVEDKESLKKYIFNKYLSSIKQDIEFINNNKIYLYNSVNKIREFLIERNVEYANKIMTYFRNNSEIILKEEIYIIFKNEFDIIRRLYSVAECIKTTEIYQNIADVIENRDINSQNIINREIYMFKTFITQNNTLLYGDVYNNAKIEIIKGRLIIIGNVGDRVLIKASNGIEINGYVGHNTILDSPAVIKYDKNCCGNNIQEINSSHHQIGLGGIR